MDIQRATDLRDLSNAFADTRKGSDPTEGSRNIVFDNSQCRVLNRLFWIRERSVPWFTPLFQKSRLVGFLSEPDYQLHRGKQAFLRAGRLTC